MLWDKQLAPLFAMARVDITKLNEENGLSFAEMQRLDQALAQRYDTCHLAMFKQGPPAIALKVTANALTQSETLREAVDCLVDMMKAINSPIQPTLTVFENQASIALTLNEAQIVHDNINVHFILALRLVKVMRILRFLSQSSLPLTILRLSESMWSPVSAFVVPHNTSAVYWNQKRNSLSFPAQYLNLPCQIKERQCLAFLSSYSDIFAAPQPEEEDFVLRLRQWVLNEVEQNNRLPNAKLAARFMGCSFKTLSRRLEEEHTTFKELKLGIVHEKAKALLSNSERPILDIAQQLGYSESASFCRSFRQFNGISPKQFRDVN